MHHHPVSGQGARHGIAVAGHRHQAGARHPGLGFDVAVEGHWHRHQLGQLQGPRLGDAHVPAVRVRRRPALCALRRQPDIELGKAGPALLLRPLPDPPAAIEHPFLNPALLPARRHVAKVRLEQIVRGHRQEPVVHLARPVRPRGLVHRRLHVVVDAPARDAAQARQAAKMRVKQHLVALARVGHQPEGPAGAQLHVRQLHLAPDPADHQPFLAPVELERLAPAKLQGHVGRAGCHRTGRCPLGPQILRHPAVMAGEALFLQLLVQAPGRPALLARPFLIGLDRLVQPGREAGEHLRPRWPLVGHPRPGCRLPEPGLDGVAGQTGPPGDLTDRQPFAQPQPPDLRVHRHGVHLFSPQAWSPAR